MRNMFVLELRNQCSSLKPFWGILEQPLSAGIKISSDFELDGSVELSRPITSVVLTVGAAVDEKSTRWIESTFVL